MKSTDSFKKVIQSHIDSVAAKDPDFAEKVKDPKKNIDDCITYILNQVKKSGFNGFEDQEIFGMAVHYYDEENVKVGAPVSAKVVVNHHVELSPEEIEEARKAALEKVMKEEEEKIRKPKKKKKQEETKSNDLTLF